MTIRFPDPGKPCHEPIEPAIIDQGRQVIRIEAAALERLADALDPAFAAAVCLIISAGHRVVVTGMGKSGHVARKIVATLSATGTPAMFLHPAEAAHGDLGMLTPGDVLIALSNSGSTPEVQLIMRYARSLGCRSIAISGRPGAPMLQAADIALLLPPAREACPVNIAPTTSTTMMIALGDALAVAVMGLRGMSRERIKVLHPGGTIGASLTPVEDLMHTGARLPLVRVDAPMRDVLVVMTEKSLGLAGVIDGSGHLVGVITDGDLRRHIDTLMQSIARDVMTPDPRTIMLGSFAGDARAILAVARITALFVVARDDPHRPVGVVHIHDLARCDIAVTADAPYPVTPDWDRP
ncbi:KpsF/GutQ family sugar-phosphate isomerase [Novosphingobium acidiphilum]|uniref:KpsF/GutQ family sugar-phosphate isomerase n=1 Tax=Novosphingobium acidiphilum TaxID=505248 RepID=UPI000426ABEE|nr:KpsF/GutQ family sugar-phosphate isomerase [Novosphingobium acidiphilum]